MKYNIFDNYEILVHLVLVQYLGTQNDFHCSISYSFLEKFVRKTMFWKHVVEMKSKLI